MATETNHAVEVFYDGACPICSREIGAYRRCRGAERVTFIDIHAAAGPRVAPDLARDAALARFHVRRADGTLVSGGAAFAALWSTLPSWRWLGRLARTRIGAWSIERGYALALRLLPVVRDKLSRRGAPGG